MRRLNAPLLMLLARLTARTLRQGRPRRQSAAQRLANLPLGSAPIAAPLRIAWTAQQIPSIEAASLDDLAAGLGMVHAHLRLAQMELMRRLATGTVAEVVGPAAIELDRALRLIGFTRAVPGIRAMLPAATRDWAQGFVDGVNHVIARAPALPPECTLLGLRPAPWTLDDLLGIGRLAATDVSWMVFARLLRGEAELPPADWQALWPLLQDGDTLPWPDGIEEAAIGLVRGSNSAVVPAARAAHGAGLIASDPHLAIMLPPLWLIAGLHAPGLDVVGLMIPGLPVVGLGRSHAIAWGGTSLHAASSDLVDVADEPMTERQEILRVRGAPDTRLRLRETRFGPVVSDGMLLRSRRPLALRWLGHRPSDEMTAMLRLMQARDFAEARAALDGFAIPGQTITVVEAGPRGRAGRITAAHLPRRKPGPMASVVCAPDAIWNLDEVVFAARDATAGDEVVASANDRPPAAAAPIGFFFSPPDRVRRLRALLDAAPPTAATMRAAQQDVVQPAALLLRDRLLGRLAASAILDRAAGRALAAWDGSYDAGSAGALAFEAMVAALTRRVVPPPARRLLLAIWSGRALMAQRIAAAPAADVAAASRVADRLLRRYRTWGNAHRLALRHPLALLPLAGRPYRLPRPPASGGNDTLNKTGHGLVTGRHGVTFGACARHVSDMADPDANWFVLLGGQDGWPGSDTATDQIALWQAGAYVRVPLRAAATRDWPHAMMVRPAGAGSAGAANSAGGAGGDGA